MQALIEYQNAARAFRAATRELTKLSNAGGEPAPGQIADWCRLCGEMNATEAEAAAAMPETLEDAAAKLTRAAVGIRSGTFEDAEHLAAEADATAERLAAGERGAPIEARLRELLEQCKYGEFAFYCNYGAVSDNHALEHIRTTLAGLARLRLAA